MADAFDDEVEPTITIGEYIEGLEAEELEADLVLGGDDGKECTYGGGYLKRQAVFSCLTCVPGGVAGVCTACSLACHDGHEVVELWTKRKFRCDCGNSKFGGFVCKLCPDKDPENLDNSYNHNFKGSYCTCRRPYPDPEAKEQVEMIQCCICEDWFHEDHLGLNSIVEIPRDEEGEPIYGDFICQQCTASFSFLKLYPPTIWASSKQLSASQAGSSNSDLLEHESSACTGMKKVESSVLADHSTVNELEKSSEGKTIPTEKDSVDGENTEGTAFIEESNAHEHSEVSESECKLGIDISVTPVLEKKAPMFVFKCWRGLLCRCKTCSDFYTQKGIAYLIDKDDSIEEYEKVAKQKREKKLEQQEGAEAKFLNSLDHVQKIEVLSGIADMKNEFQSFLESFDTSKPVTEEDIRAVFENLAKKKKQRLS